MAPKGTTADKKKANDKLADDKKDKPESGIPEENELNDEDRELKEELNLCVTRLTENDETLYKGALEILRSKIRTATSSLTSVPKPLKFLREHYETICSAFDKMKGEGNRLLCADVLSCLAMVMSENRDCLKYRLLGPTEGVGEWGHEYIRHLAGEVAAEWTERTAENPDANVEDLLRLVNIVLPYDMTHNSETDAADMLMEIERLDLLIDACDSKSYKKVTLYLKSCVPYTPDPENTTLLKTALAIYLKFEKFTEAMFVALQLNDEDVIIDIFDRCKDNSILKQCCYILGRQQRFVDLPERVPDVDDLTELMSNSHLSGNFLGLARELDIMEPKKPEDIYKSDMDKFTSNLDSARANLASSYVNGFVNCGFGTDKLLTTDTDSSGSNSWIWSNKDHGMIAATASLGLILLWDVDNGLVSIDKHLYSAEDKIKAGALLACGIVNAGIRNECDPALALLSDYVTSSSLVIRRGCALGLGIAYCGSNRDDVIQLLIQQLQDPKSTMEEIGCCALALGLIAVGSCNGDVTTAILQILIEKSESNLKETHARFLALALGLCYLQKQDLVDTIIAALEVVPEPLRSFATILVEVCAYAGTGNVLKIQKMLHICSEKPEEKEDEEKEKEKEKEKDKKEKKKDKKEKDRKDGRLHKQSIAAIGVALIAMGEDIGSEMSFRTFGHLLRYGEPPLRRAVPLAIALTSISNPQMSIIDTLSKFSHDSDAEVAYNSIFAMGLVGSGTNNARLAQMLRQLALFYQKDANALMMVRIAQGLVHLGKGTMSLQPFHSDRTLLNVSSAAALISTVVAALDPKGLLLGKHHYLLYSIVPAIQPRLLVCLDEDSKPMQVSVRVGQAVDVVGQAGKPKTITGFQTRTTPVLLSFGERAELATDEYIALSQVLEGFVMLKKNPDAMDTSEK